MRILIADDDAVSRRALELAATKWGYQVTVTVDGATAWDALRQGTPPELALLDWMMPGLDGVEVCRRVRASSLATYVILVSARDEMDDIVAGLEAGADDYLTKPVAMAELQARLKTGARIVELQRSLAHRIDELADALTRVKQLQGLLPICSYCKKIRDDKNYWQQVESYISSHTEARFSHGICPDCFESVVKPEMERLGIKPP